MSESFMRPEEDIPYQKTLETGSGKSDISILLEDAQRYVDIAQTSAEDVESLIKERQSLIDSVFELVQADNINGVYSPLHGISVSDYVALEQEAIISGDEKSQYEKIDTLILKMQEQLNGDSSEGFISTLSTLGNVRLSERVDLHEKITTEQASLQQDFNDIINRITEIEENPRVNKRIHEMAEIDMRLDIETKEKAIAETLKKATMCIDSLSARHRNGFQEIQHYTGIENIKDMLMEAYRSGDKQSIASTFSSILNKLELAVMEGEGTSRLEHPGQVVPWKKNMSSIQYMDALNFLRNWDVESVIAKHADDGELLKKRDTVLTENEVLHRLFGAPQYIDHKTGQKRESSFWASFKKRRENDTSGETARIKEERKVNEEKMEKQRQAVQEIIDAGGFRVLVPRFEKRGNKHVPVIPQAGAVRVSARFNKNAQLIIDVVDAIGGAEDAKGKTYMETNMPVWLQRGLGEKGIADLKKSLTESMQS